MKEYSLTVEELKEFAPKLCAGDRVLLSGKVYTARDAAHIRIFEALEKNDALPFSINGAVIYYAGPTPTPENLKIGSCGPTTSCRMDSFTPRLLDLGLTATIGKGERNNDVIDAIMRNHSVYLCAIGGAGALAALHITDCKVIAYEDLGCESVKELTFSKFPLTVGVDSKGNSIFNH